MSDGSGITKLMLITVEGENSRYAVEVNSLEESMKSGDDLPAVQILGGAPEFCYIRVNKKVMSSPLQFFMITEDFFDFMDALKIKSVRHRNTWVDSPDADSIVDDAESRLHKYSSSYPGLSAFFKDSSGYDGEWTEFLPPL